MSRVVRNNYVLIGFMGSGKTTIGRELSRTCAMPRFDLDELIEEKAGKSIPEIFAESGNEGFRAIETQVLRSLVRSGAEGYVYSTGGGCVTMPENLPLLKQLGLVVYLRIQPETVLKRIGKDTSRPLLQTPDKETRVREMMMEREPLYQAAADIVIEADHGRMDVIVDEIVEKGRQFHG